MAKKKNDETINNESNLISSDPNVPRPRLHKLIIKNFRAIGNVPVEIELDEIVVLVGPNNVGKSSILRAYQVVMNQGSNEGKLSIEDFPHGIVDEKKYPQVELQTIVHDNSPGEEWIYLTENGEKLVREMWTWKSPNANPIRQGYNIGKKDWDDRVPWGAPNIAKSRRPIPHHIDAFASPEAQAQELIKILQSLLIERLKAYKNTDNDKDNKSDYHLLLDKVSELQNKIVSETQEEIEKIETEISIILSKVFPKYKVKFDAKPDSDIEKSLNLFKANPDLRMGPEDGYLSKVEQQGSGARRTLLWTTLRFLAESSNKNSGQENTRPHVLLIDEPEICLHPNAIRECRRVLYELPKTNNWQVMITTHSPIFIDLSYDNTTIIRVDTTSDGIIKGTTLYRPQLVQLDADDKANLKLLNICDPYVNEFFFGGNIIVVEGDTEYTAFCHIKSLYPDLYNNTQVIRARGKATIVSLIKILNHFSTNYSVLHDCDLPIISSGKNPAWSINDKILTEIKLNVNGKTRLMACIYNFEKAFFGKTVGIDKPYNALHNIKTDSNVKNKIKMLFDSLINFDNSPPAGVIEWKQIDDLKIAVEKVNAS